jgi:hypothetical protein
MVTDEEYWEALQNRICRKCIDGDGYGGCAISDDRECSLKKHLPLILKAVNSVYSKSIEAYEEQIRSRVCGHCSSQSADGNCALREHSECALDRYFPLIVQVIEETQLNKRLHRDARAPSGAPLAGIPPGQLPPGSLPKPSSSESDG